MKSTIKESGPVDSYMSETDATCKVDGCDNLPTYGPDQEYCFGHWMSEVTE